ncbi:uncharacterized protein LOC114130688 [Aphis gossypii]|uniref:Uncharacterized protein n=1 Tax=Aphis gossypii TaxID=80765 RepID=A0A9P0IZY1_APHGO|nr:uncharacterized protein LOC114130688 [Aphis gossypii]XP_050057374.1 uncharacterized protein LOC114130688 [Aphis gossypii]CAH1722599.1 unnamed protein product [Aphis gossypii]
MIFINYSFLALIFINFLFYVRSESCNYISNFFTKKTVFVFNTEESVEFLPTEFKTQSFGWFSLDFGNNTVYPNLITYKNNDVETLSDSDLKINNDDMMKALHKSLINNERLHDVISVFPTRYVVRIAGSTNVRVFTFKFGVDVEIDHSKCEIDKIRFIKSVIKGMICKTIFASGTRYNIKCDTITLNLLPIDESGKLEVEKTCKK